MAPFKASFSVIDSLSKRACVDGAGNEVAPPRQYWNTFSLSTLEKVGEYSTTTSRRGRHSVTLERVEMIEVSSIIFFYILLCFFGVFDNK